MALELLETLGELGFVIQLLVFTYSLFWLYLTFRDLPLMFGISSVAVGFLVFIHGVSVTILVASFVFLVLFGMQIQQMLWFGLFPLLGYHVAGDHLISSDEMDQTRLQSTMALYNERAERGLASADELQFLERHGAMNQMSGQNASAQQMQMMRNTGMLS